MFKTKVLSLEGRNPPWIKRQVLAAQGPKHHFPPGQFCNLGIFGDLLNNTKKKHGKLTEWESLEGRRPLDVKGFDYLFATLLSTWCFHWPQVTAATRTVQKSEAPTAVVPTHPWSSAPTAGKDTLCRAAKMRWGLMGIDMDWESHKVVICFWVSKLVNITSRVIQH